MSRAARCASGSSPRSLRKEVHETATHSPNSRHCGARARSDGVGRRSHHGDRDRAHPRRVHGAGVRRQPCTGTAITSFDADGNIVAHVTYFLEDGEPTEVWATFTETGNVTPTDANDVTYTGHFTAWGNFNLNERNTNNTFTLTFRASGSDGSSLIATRLSTSR
jgi:hypothetical protein